MTKLKVFNKMMNKAKLNRYCGNDYKFQVGFILDGSNINSLIFRNDFAKAVFGEELIKPDGINFIPNWEQKLKNLINEDDVWRFLEENI